MLPSEKSWLEIMFILRRLILGRWKLLKGRSKLTLFVQPLSITIFFHLKGINKEKLSS